MNMTAIRALGFMAAMAAALLAPGEAAANQRHALLVGVSSYPTLGQNLQLHGPKNDVVLMRTLLQQRGFDARNIRVLADGLAGAGEPTRAAIMNELKAIAGRVGRGDFVFLFFAGHGSQQPAKNLGPQNPEPDGLDEMFLPRDIGKWSGATESVQNAIVDDELGAAITAIRNRGAFVWAVFDTCHSGTITRGIEDEGVRYRDVRPATLGIPDTAMVKAEKQAAELFPRTRGGPASQAPMVALQAASASSDAGGFVAFYAAQSSERAPEERLPAGHPDRQSHGVFTFALAQTLAMNPSMTYRQAAQQILQRYRGRNQGHPTPLFEGPGTSLDQPVFGSSGGAMVQQWRIEKDASGTLRIAAGALHQLSEGAVFAVMRNPGAPDKDAIGYVNAARVEVLQTRVMPADHAGKPKLAASAIPEDAYARLVNPNLSLVLRVALPPAAASPGAHDGKAKAVLDQLAKEKPAGIAVSWVPAREGGDIRLVVRHDKLWLLPSSAELIAEGPHKSLSIDLATNDSKQLREKLVDSLRRVAKATNILRLAGQIGMSPVAQKLETQYLVERAPVRPAQGFTDPRQCDSVKLGKPEPLRPDQLADLRECDKVTVRVVNRNSLPVDVTLLMLDSEYGIESLFPGSRSGGTNRVEPNGGTIAPQFYVLATTVGRESVILIATEGRPGEETADFGFLRQASIERTRGGGVRGAGAGDLRDILSTIGFEPERTRGGGAAVPQQALSSTVMRVFTWTTVAK